MKYLTIALLLLSPSAFAQHPVIIVNSGVGTGSTVRLMETDLGRRWIIIINTGSQPSAWYSGLFSIREIPDRSLSMVCVQPYSDTAKALHLPLFYPMWHSMAAVHGGEAGLKPFTQYVWFYRPNWKDCVDWK